MRLKKLTGIPFIIALKIILFIVLPIGAIHTFQTYQAFKKGILAIETDYVNEMKSQLRLNVNNLLSQFELESTLTETKVRAILKADVESIHTMLTGLFEKLPSVLHNEKELAILKHTLRSIRFWDGKGYYFAFSYDGTVQVYPPDPGVEGQSWLDLKDSEGKFILRNMITMAKREDSVYYTYTWPRPHTREPAMPKMTCVKAVKPLKWVVGTEIYLEDMESLAQSDALKMIEHLKLAPYESMVIMDRSGRIITSRLPAMTESESETFLQSIQESAQELSGGYLWFPQPSRPGGIAPFLAYSRTFDKWGWTVSYVLDNARIQNIIASEKRALKKEIIHAITTILLIIIASIVAIYFIGRYFGNKVKKSFSTFSDFFSKASKEYAHIDIDRLQFREFEQLAVFANNMVDERIRKEAIIRAFTGKLQQANRKLKKIASLDGLTGVANRRYFDEVLRKEWARAMRNGNPISLAMIDIDFFKIYNDTFGHQQGDACLRKVAKALGVPLKRPTDLLARYGGEEFVVLLPETESEGVITLADEMRAEVATLSLIHKGSTVSDRVTFSMGITTMVPERDAPPDMLVQQADKALYLAKEEGRDRYKIL